MNVIVKSSEINTCTTFCVLLPLITITSKSYRDAFISQIKWKLISNKNLWFYSIIHLSTIPRSEIKLLTKTQIVVLFQTDHHSVRETDTMLLIQYYM